MSYCGSSDGSKFIGLLNPADQASDPSDVTTKVLDKLNQNGAVRITNSINRQRFGPLYNQRATEEQIIAASNTNQLRILSFINAQLTGLDLILIRGTETSQNYFIGRRSLIAFNNILWNWLDSEDSVLYRAWQRSPYYTLPLPTFRPSYRETVFSGSGNSNIVVTGDYANQESSTITIEITGSNTLQWKQDIWKGDADNITTPGSFSPVTFTVGTAILLANGIYVALPLGTVISDQWTITITVTATTTLVAGYSAGWNPNVSDVNPVEATANQWLDEIIACLYARVTEFTYPLNNLNKDQAMKYGEIANEFANALILQAQSFNSTNNQLTVPAFQAISNVFVVVKALVENRDYDETYGIYR